MDSSGSGHKGVGRQGKKSHSRSCPPDSAPAYLLPAALPSGREDLRAGKTDNGLLQLLSSEDPPRWYRGVDKSIQEAFLRTQQPLLRNRGERREGSVTSSAVSLGHGVIMKCLIKFENANTLQAWGEGWRCNSISGSIHKHLLSPLW